MEAFIEGMVNIQRKQISELQIKLFSVKPVLIALLTQ